MQPKYPIRSDFHFESDSKDSVLTSGWKGKNFELHIITDSGGNRKATVSEVESVCNGQLNAQLALYPQTAGLDAVDIDRGGLPSVKTIIEQLSSYTPHKFLVLPSKTVGRYHIYIPVTGDRLSAENTSPKWQLQSGGGEIKGGTSRITLYHPVSVLNYATQLFDKENRVDPEVIRRELCAPRQAAEDRKDGNYKKFLQRDLSQHDNILTAFLAIFEAGKNGELEPEKVEILTQEITDKAVQVGRNQDEISRMRIDASKHVESHSGPESDTIILESRAVRAADIDIAGFVFAKFNDLIKYSENSGKYVCWIDEKRKITRANGHSWQCRDILSDISKMIVLRFGSDDKERLYYGSAQRAQAVERLFARAIGDPYRIF